MINIQENIPLKSYTTLKIGGPARYFVEAKTEEELKEAVTWAKEKQTPYLVIAGGSNLLISDDGYEGLIIRFTFSGIEQKGEDIIVHAGTPLQELVDYTINKGLDGMSAMTGVPGTVGGAIYGSAGAYGDNIRDYLKEVSYFDGENITTITKEKYDTGYRDSIFKKHKDWIIVEARFGGFPKSAINELKKESEEVLKKRAIKYPTGRNTPGSFFKNIPEDSLSLEQLETIRKHISEWEQTQGYKKRFGDKPVVMFGKIPAGNPIDMLGGNGDSQGQIKIDEYHGNTFINLGNGTAHDFFKLAQKWKNKVKDAYGIELEPEVQLIGFKEEF